MCRGIRQEAWVDRDEQVGEDRLPECQVKNQALRQLYLIVNTKICIASVISSHSQDALQGCSLSVQYVMLGIDN